MSKSKEDTIYLARVAANLADRRLAEWGYKRINDTQGQIKCLAEAITELRDAVRYLANALEAEE